MLLIKEELRKYSHIDSPAVEFKTQTKSSTNLRLKKKHQNDHSKFREFISPNGVKILVGRNRRDNEKLSLKVAKVDEIWMHSRCCPGAQVVLRKQEAGRNRKTNVFR